jgi:O-antigen ligase
VCCPHADQEALLGWGLGAFPIVYPEFRSFYTSLFVNQAHNDYLPLLVETGLVGFSVAIWFLVLVFRQAASKLKNWTETASGAMTVASMLGCIGILVHSFLDFNLQIPANAALFYVLCALAASAPLQESQRRRVVRRHDLIVQTQHENCGAVIGFLIVQARTLLSAFCMQQMSGYIEPFVGCGVDTQTWTL